MKKTSIETLASQYGLTVDFVKSLHDKIVDKENITRAVKMFNDGLLPFDMATGNEPINVAEYRSKVARNMWNRRKLQAEQFKATMEHQKRIFEYYSECRRLTFQHKQNKAVSDAVFIKDGQLVAFGYYEPIQGGIYAANNEVMPDFRWNPHECLARLRKLNKAFYRQVKKAAFNSPKEWFDFNIKS